MGRNANEQNGLKDAQLKYIVFSRMLIDTCTVRVFFMEQGTVVHKNFTM